MQHPAPPSFWPTTLQCRSMLADKQQHIYQSVQRGISGSVLPAISESKCLLVDLRLIITAITVSWTHSLWATVAPKHHSTWRSTSCWRKCTVASYTTNVTTAPSQSTVSIEELSKCYVNSNWFIGCTETSWISLTLMARWLQGQSVCGKILLRQLLKVTYRRSGQTRINCWKCMVKQVWKLALVHWQHDGWRLSFAKD